MESANRLSKETRQLFSTARIAKDRNYDGRFFFGVNTTGIFCRPSCPAPIARERNVRYFQTLYEAMEQGFRPCLRCRPDIVSLSGLPNPAGSQLVQSALQLIRDDFLREHTIGELAGCLGISERHLRQLFTDSIGTTPARVDRHQRALFSRRMLLTSGMPISEVAFASGFGSIRQFNEVIRNTFGSTPGGIRCQAPAAMVEGRTSTFGIPYEKPFHFAPMLSFLKNRAISGVEMVTEESYSRTFRTPAGAGYFSVRDNRAGSCLDVTLDCDDIRCLIYLHARIRRMFDIDRDFTPINACFANDPLLSPGMIDGHVPRLPVAFDPFEYAVRAVLGQQISVQAATTIAGRIARLGAVRCAQGQPAGLDYFFPLPEELAELDLAGIGVTTRRQQTLHAVARSVMDGTLRLNPELSLDTFRAAFSRIRGIGEWTVQYVAMRGLGMIDCFPESDLGVIRALSDGGARPGRAEILERVRQWQPYRSYAALCLWRRDVQLKERA